MFNIPLLLAANRTGIDDLSLTYKGTSQHEGEKNASDEGRAFLCGML